MSATIQTFWQLRFTFSFVVPLGTVGWDGGQKLTCLVYYGTGL